MRSTAAIELRAAPGAVFDLVADFGRLHEWDPNVVSSSWRGVGLRAGERCDVVVAFLGLEAAVVYELIESTPDLRAVYRGRASKLESIDTVTVTPVPGGSRLELTADVTLRGALRLLRPVLPIVFAAGARRALRALRHRFGG